MTMTNSDTDLDELQRNADATRLAATLDAQARALQQYADLDAALKRSAPLTIVIDGGWVEVSGDGEHKASTMIGDGGVLTALTLALGMYEEVNDA
jgi:hypothetical protein